ncbi:copper chaperone PCu(A)C [Burkholderiaceae bacterium DAT-1]|nr:copper chaperone PCu(A)C [Burkholderiaceae bacterium DAT-1]
MTMLKATVALLLCTASWAADITVAHAWAKATVPGQSVGAAYFSITSKQDAVLEEVQSPVAGMVMIHEMKMDKGMMQMHEVDGGLKLPAGKSIELKPGGLHIMLMELKSPLKAGERVPLTLVIKSKGKSQTVQVNADIKPLGE